MTEHRRMFDEGNGDALAKRKPVINSLTRAMENGRAQVFDPYMRGYRRGLLARFVFALSGLLRLQQNS